MIPNCSRFFAVFLSKIFIILICHPFPCLFLIRTVVISNMHVAWHLLVEKLRWACEIQITAKAIVFTLCKTKHNSLGFLTGICVKAIIHLFSFQLGVK